MKEPQPLRGKYVVHPFVSFVNAAWRFEVAAIYRIMKKLVIGGQPPQTIVSGKLSFLPIAHRPQKLILRYKMSEIVIPEKGNLHKVIEFVERMSDKIDSMEADATAKVTEKSAELETRQRELGEKSEELALEVEGLKAQRDALVADNAGAAEKFAEIEARCDALDKALPRGEKAFVGATPAQDAAGLNLGRAITAARRKARGDSVPEQFARAVGGNTNTATDGSIVVPTEVHNQIVHGIKEKSIARQICRVIPMASDTVNVGTIANVPNVEVRANGGDGAEVTTDSSVTFRDKALSASTYVCVNKLSKELDEDSLVNLEPVLGELYAEALAEEENNQLINGTTTGLANIARHATTADRMRSVDMSTTASATMDGIVYSDIPALMYSVDEGYANSGTFITSGTNFRYVVGLQDATNGTPLFASSWGGGGLAGPGSALPSSMAPGFLAGRPVYTSGKMPVAAAGNAAEEDLMYFGDFSKFAMGDRRSVSVTWDDSVYAYELNRAVIVSQRVGFLCLIPEAFSVLLPSAD